MASEGVIKFRHDINAMRALAVTAVVLFHYKVRLIQGGFVGVDVFFVISGYLMTVIIMERLTKDRFNIWNFYYDRAMRIVPGLLGVCIALLAVGYFILEPGTYQYLGSTASAALLFFSNFWFWETTGYFDRDLYTKWFLHTWSLSLEWQFYLAYPIILMGLYASERTRRLIVPILWSIAILSFALCVWSTNFHQASAFYLLPQRAWELLVGGIVALQFRNSKWRRPWIVLSFGFLLIGISVVYYNGFIPWPSYSALLPVLGTSLVIAANRADAALFQNRIIQAIGKWSYSIYLWHWPIAAGAAYFNLDDFEIYNPRSFKISCEILVTIGIVTVGGPLLSLAKRAMTDRLVITRLHGIALGGTALAISVGFAIVLAINDGLPGRRADVQMVLAGYGEASRDWDYPTKECDGLDAAENLRPCQLGPANRSGTLFIGDSFAKQIFSRFAERARSDSESSFTFLTMPSCPPVPGIRMVHDRFHCNGYFEKAMQFVEAHRFKRLVLVSIWNYFRPAYSEICMITQDRCVVETDPARYYQRLDDVFFRFRARLLSLRSHGTEVVILSPTPWGKWNVPLELAKRKFLGIDTAEVEAIDRDQFESTILPIKKRLISLALSSGSRFVDPADYLCDAHRCRTTNEDGMPLYRDQYHLRAGAVKSSRFQFLDDAAGLSNRLSAAPDQSRTP